MRKNSSGSRHLSKNRVIKDTDLFNLGALFSTTDHVIFSRELFLPERFHCHAI